MIRRSEESIKGNYKKPCGCGCGELIWHKDHDYRIRRFKLNHNPSGNNARHWKGGKAVFNGYIALHRPDHPFSHHGYVYEHRLVWEEANNAILLPWGDVHHIDENKQNNFIGNLQAMMHYRHTRLEMRKKR